MIGGGIDVATGATEGKSYDMVFALGGSIMQML